MKSLNFAGAMLLIGFLSAPIANASEVFSQVVTLEPGWNIVSTPKVLESHSFSADETSDNFDIYALDPSQASGWATMSMLGQDTFTPLYGYFVQNKTGVEQSLTYNYRENLTPNEQLFERTFSTTGWYSVGVANAEYAKAQGANTLDSNNPSKILSLLSGKYDTVIDFTDSEYRSNPASVAIGDSWKGVVPEDINSLNDLRETKGYAVYMKEANAVYSGFQSAASSTGSDNDVENFTVNITGGYTTENTSVRGGAKFEFDIQPTETDIVLGTIVIKVSTPGATTSEIIDGSLLNISGQLLPGLLVEDMGESALFAYNLDQRYAVAAGQKLKIATSFTINEDFSDPTNTQQIQFSVGSDEIESWELYSGNSLIPVSEIGGTATSQEYTIFSYGAIIDDLSVEGRRTNIPNVLEFQVDFRADFEGQSFNIIEDSGLSYNVYTNASSTVNGLSYRLEGPDGFLSTSTVEFEKYENHDRAYVDYIFTVEGSIPGDYTFIIEEVLFVDNLGNQVVGVFEEYLGEEDKAATSNILNPSDSLTGFADLDQFNLFPADNTTVAVGARDTVLGVSEASFIDGDAIIENMDIQFAATPVDANLWEVFDSLSLWVDGDKIADMTTDSAADFLGSSDNVVRFSDLGLIAMRDEIVEIVIAADIASTTGSEELGDYELQVSELAYTDAASATTVVTQFDDIGQYGGVNFEIQPVVEELTFALSANNPDSTILVVEDNVDSDPYTVFTYDISADDSNVNITINELEVTVRVGASTYFDIVDDAALIIDGFRYENKVVTNGDTDSATLRFEIDGLHVIERGTFEEVQLELTFNPLEPAFEGVTVQAEVNSANVDATSAVGIDDLSPFNLNGTAVGETHVLQTEGIMVPADSVQTTTTSLGENGQIGEFTIEFEMTSFGNDLYITDSGLNYRLDGGTAIMSSVVSSTADDVTGVFTVREEETQTFTLTVVIDPDVSSLYRLVLESIEFSDNPDGLTNSKIQYLFPESDFRTSYLFVQGE